MSSYPNAVSSKASSTPAVGGFPGYAWGRTLAKVVWVGALVVVMLLATLSPQGVLSGGGVLLALAPQVRVLAKPRSVKPGASLAGPEARPRLVVRATAYNSHPTQTDATPHTTATGARTRFGVIAVSRDLLAHALPYGSLVRMRDLGSYRGTGVGAYQQLLDQQGLFIVEDTMHPRKTQQVDVWFQDHRSALNWGVRRVELEVVRYARTGPLLGAELKGEWRGSHAPWTQPLK